MDYTNVTVDQIPDPIRIVRDYFVVDIMYFQGELKFNFFNMA